MTLRMSTSHFVFVEYPIIIDDVLVAVDDFSAEIEQVFQH